MKQYHKWLLGEIGCISIGILLCIGFVYLFQFFLPLRVFLGVIIGIVIGNWLLGWYHTGTKVEDAEEPLFKKKPPKQ